MPRQEAEIINKLGLHARASAKLTQTASAYQSEVWLERNGKRVNAKSIMGVMMLAAARGSTITIDTNGNDADEAMSALIALIADKFGEGE
ncbi:MAG TPA: HPr family phosphocarrier protein [Zoogloea sp.]|jgi:phosphocarrier protein HPr|uniref:HPr family phosphocarrier protein n=1 Tax=Zoogloea sp. TaxID=49181 RepID=UPI002C396C46|nr:HPr family phosphocarrier protein [Zoogloea sp.]